jgi:hypothetical protein
MMQNRSLGDPRRQVLPAPVVHANLTAVVPPGRGGLGRTRGVGRGSRSWRSRTSWIRRPARQRTTIKPRIRWATHSVAGDAHNRDDLLDPAWVGRVAQALVPRCTPAWNSGNVARERGRPVTSKPDTEVSLVDQPNAAALAQRGTRAPTRVAGCLRAARERSATRPWSEHSNGQQCPTMRERYSGAATP